MWSFKNREQSKFSKHLCISRDKQDASFPGTLMFQQLKSSYWILFSHFLPLTLIPLWFPWAQLPAGSSLSKFAGASNSAQNELITACKSFLCAHAPPCSPPAFPLSAQGWTAPVPQLPSGSSSTARAGPGASFASLTRMEAVMLQSTQTALLSPNLCPEEDVIQAKKWRNARIFKSVSKVGNGSSNSTVRAGLLN